MYINSIKLNLIIQKTILKIILGVELESNNKRKYISLFISSFVSIMFEQRSCSDNRGYNN